MPGQSKLPSDARMRELHEEGLTNQQIASRYGVTREAVRQKFARMGLDRGPRRADHRRFLPWRMRAQHQQDVLARRLRELSKREQGFPLTDTENRNLDEWLAFMEGDNDAGVPLAVHYNMNDPEGFWLQPRTDEDDGLVSP